RLSVHQLEQLDGELDVAQAPWTQLQLHVDLGRGDVLGDALPHPLDTLDEPFARGAGPDLGLHAFDVAFAKDSIARQRTGLDHRLARPALRPPRVVRQVRFEGTHERPVLALWSQVRVYLPQRRLVAEAVGAAHGLHGQGRSDLDRPVRGEVVGRLNHEHHVNVTDVVELAGSGLSHADDREAGGRHLLG